MDDEYEDIVEESLVLVEFAGNTGDDALNQDNNVSMKILGVESEQPIIQMGKQLYRGEYQDTLGTELFFREVEGDHTSDSLFDTKLDTKLVYCGKANKKLLSTEPLLKLEKRMQKVCPMNKIMKNQCHLHQARLWLQIRSNCYVSILTPLLLFLFLSSMYQSEI